MRSLTTSMFKNSLFLPLMVTMSACAPLAATYQDGTVGAKAASTGPTPAPAAKPDLSCFDNLVDYELHTNIINFQLSNGGGVSAGFSPGGFLSAIGGNVQYASGNLTTTMNLWNPMKTHAAIVDASGVGTATNVSFGANFTAGLVGVGGNGFTSTPVDTLSNAAMQDNLNNIATALNAKGQDAWWTHVSNVVSQNQFQIPVGKNAGIQVGDEFKIMNVAFDWEGAPCQSEMTMARLLSDQPIAVAKVSQISDDTSFLTVTSSNGMMIDKYNYVTISKLVQPPQPQPDPGCWFNCSVPTVVARTDLKRSLRISTVTSRPLTFVIDTKGTTQNIDIAPFVTEQLKVLMGASSYTAFYVRQ